ncbi:unnamed protein product [Lymnaea stagnalis]|uniref:Uncharacterized protein n=1 Tax=Lymnaea stagnalis TaxID=6523 RepID=A0AAV2IJG9_LYMST
MNADHTTSMSPNTFRRLLAAHGRSSTLGMFDTTTQIDANKIIKKLIENKKNPDGADAGGKQPLHLDSDHIVAKYLVESTQPPRDAVMNPPLSKVHSSEPNQVLSSYSFYKRPFKVYGKEAWEFAMRDLGSIDTLLNRYGYVKPQLRGKLNKTNSAEVIPN